MIIIYDRVVEQGILEDALLERYKKEEKRYYHVKDDTLKTQAWKLMERIAQMIDDVRQGKRRINIE